MKNRINRVLKSVVYLSLLLLLTSCIKVETTTRQYSKNLNDSGLIVDIEWKQSDEQIILGSNPDEGNRLVRVILTFPDESSEEIYFDKKNGDEWATFGDIELSEATQNKLRDIIADPQLEGEDFYIYLNDIDMPNVIKFSINTSYSPLDIAGFSPVDIPLIAEETN